MRGKKKISHENGNQRTELDTVEEQTDLVTDEIFMELAEQRGTVYSLKGFELAFNYEELNTSTDMIRFIEVEV